MYWHLVHTKPRQEQCARYNLEQQGYQCYLPTLPSERLRQRLLTVIEEPLFPRYLFIKFALGQSVGNWAAVRSTRGVSRLVSFGAEPARVDDRLIDRLRAQEAEVKGRTKPLFSPGERVQLLGGAFAGVEGIYQMVDGERRVMVLIELLSSPVLLHLEPGSLRKLG